MLLSGLTTEILKLKETSPLAEDFIGLIAPYEGAIRRASNNDLKELLEDLNNKLPQDIAVAAVKEIVKYLKDSKKFIEYLVSMLDINASAMSMSDVVGAHGKDAAVMKKSDKRPDILKYLLDLFAHLKAMMLSPWFGEEVRTPGATTSLTSQTAGSTLSDPALSPDPKKNNMNAFYREERFVNLPIIALLFEARRNIIAANSLLNSREVIGVRSVKRLIIALWQGKGTKASIKCSKSNRDLMSYLLMNKNSELLKIFIAAGIDPNTELENGIGPLLYVSKASNARKYDLDKFKILIFAGARIGVNSLLQHCHGKGRYLINYYEGLYRIFCEKLTDADYKEIFQNKIACAEIQRFLNEERFHSSFQHCWSPIIRKILEQAQRFNIVLTYNPAPDLEALNAQQLKLAVTTGIGSLAGTALFASSYLKSISADATLKAFTVTSAAVLLSLSSAAIVVCLMQTDYISAVNKQSRAA
jgi:DNA-binding transcriptional regulator GbsR (MarR family)